MSAPLHDPMDIDILFRFVNGLASAGERIAVERWMDRDPAHRERVVTLAEMWAMTDAPPALRRNPQVMWQRLASEMASREANGDATAIPPMSGRPLVLVPAVRRSRRIVTVRRFAVAATIALCLGIGAYATRHHWLGTHDMIAAMTTPATTEVATTRGQRASVRLADGTRVILGVASRIRYPREFGATTRDVTLEGEAYFDVVHDGRAPFRVRTAQGVTQDIGTKFSVRAYGNEARTRVVVEEGTVSVGAGVILSAGDVARMSRGTPPTVEHDAQVKRFLSWTTGKLEFVGEPLSEVAADLGRWYNIEMRVADRTLAAQPITAAFHDESARHVLDFIARVANARIEQRGGVYLFVPEVRSDAVNTGRANPHTVSPR